MVLLEMHGVSQINQSQCHNSKTKRFNCISGNLQTFPDLVSPTVYIFFLHSDADQFSECQSKQDSDWFFSTHGMAGIRMQWQTLISMLKYFSDASHSND